MAVVYTKTKGLTDVPLSYCPGCTHGLAQKLVAETLEELDILGKTIGIAPVGCSVFAYDFYNCDMIQAPHGRAPAVATGAKRANPNNILFTYQGDGDLAAIGTAETIHAAARGENITIIFINNAIYGMTGGQMAPTSLQNQVTTTTPYGRNGKLAGYPIKMAEMLATMDGTALSQRVSLHDIPNIRKTKAAIKKAFRYQVEGKGFTIIEILSNCPTNWGVTPVQSLEWIKDNMLPYYPLGVYKDIAGEVN